MKALYLKFASETEANAILYRIEAKEPVANYRNIDTIGVIYKPTGVMLTNEDGIEYPEMQAIDGWHVNVWVLPEEDATALQPYVITPTNPVRVWG